MRKFRNFCKKMEAQPHLKDFFIYILIIIVSVIGVFLLFSRNNLSQTQPQTNIATNSAAKKTEQPEVTSSSINGTNRPEVTSSSINGTNRPEITSSSNAESKQYSQPFTMKIDTNKKYIADLQTSSGTIQIELFAKETPITVNNFVELSKNGFYDGTIFHRVIKGFMIQGGDPKGDGTGGPGYKFDDEPIARDYKRGIVAMANSGPNTNGSQFFIMHEDYNLPKNYVIFGQVISGIETVDKIANVEIKDNGFGEKSSPVQKITIEKINITEE